MSGNASLMMWAQRVVSKRTAPAHELLDIRADASQEEAQIAFHKLARMAHPDLHRNSLGPDELEVLTAAYAIVAGAYQTFRTQTMATASMRPVERPTPQPSAPSPSAPPPVTPSGPAPAANAAQAMNSKAILYYRKAELALKRGDLKSALLQIKLAIAADPQSGFLRSALAEVEVELKRGP
jgi:hypothetical protein